MHFFHDRPSFELPFFDVVQFELCAVWKVRLAVEDLVSSGVVEDLHPLSVAFVIRN